VHRPSFGHQLTDEKPGDVAASARDHHATRHVNTPRVPKGTARIVRGRHATVVGTIA
jgi:hypothetical protein